mmetsp:Transcript_39646/g.58228  ORF Transcript_39646/g.58228 Transcript_39646/m.58228 type:complete len:114 (+) Transcript_39646:196-537(+)|eukprot:CAMPEP_0195520574 /NCGR_PEP_ID=MMETSP0794_2-20130614/17198_1 /TAXON_ID=515487 /ORGANISM="Stephanopyxis turris, Strain CCMP 815" /LENGTH=113 /DNA_ID=CAMNT_0040649959 /DNA_START=184 /DNA_END=525 /DNA_ORIENTATION=+
MSDEEDRKLPAKTNSEEEEEYVKLISAEGHTFYLSRPIALVSATMRAMLEGPFRESSDATCRFPDISGHVLEKVIAYLHYKVRYSDATVRIPEFKIEPEIALELLVAANYLDC